jgi:hypothetical protein
MTDELQPYQQRVVAEKAELDGKLDKLKAFLVADSFVAVNNAEQDRLLRQAKAMGEYSKILGERIAAW